MEEWKEVRRVLNEFGDKLVDAYKTNLISSDRRGTGHLIESLMGAKQINDDDGAFAIELDLVLPAYAEQTEWGRGPTKNSGDGSLRKAILQWISDKKIVPRPDKNGRVPTPEGLAFIISRKIHEEGYQGKPDLRNAWNSIESSFMRELDAAIDKDVDDAFTVITRGL